MPEDWSQELEHLISAGNLNELYRQVYLADPDQREQALGAPNTLYKVKTEFGANTFCLQPQRPISRRGFH